MPFAFIIPAAATLIGSTMQSNAAKSAAATQANAANQAAQLQQQQFNTINQQQAPYRQSGYSALNQIGSMLGGAQPKYDQNGNYIGDQQGSGYLTQQFGPDQLKSNLAPNYQFMLNQGVGAGTQAGNVGGGGSNVQRSNQIFGENYASNAYQNAFNNYQTQRTGIYNTLAGIAGLGQNAQNTTANLASNTASNIGQAAVGSAAAQAAGQTGVASALGTGLNTLGSMQYTNNLLSKYSPQGGAGYTPYSVPSTPNTQLDYGFGNVNANTVGNVNPA